MATRQIAALKVLAQTCRDRARRARNDAHVYTMQGDRQEAKVLLDKATVFDDDASALEALLAERKEAREAIELMLSSDDVIAACTDEEVREAAENGWTSEIRNSAEAVLAGRTVLRKLRGEE